MRWNDVLWRIQFHTQISTQFYFPRFQLNPAFWCPPWNSEIWWFTIIIDFCNYIDDNDMSCNKKVYRLVFKLLIIFFEILLLRWIERYDDILEWLNWLVWYSASRNDLRILHERTWDLEQVASWLNLSGN